MQLPAYAIAHMTHRSLNRPCTHASKGASLPPVVVSIDRNSICFDELMLSVTASQR